MEQLTMTEILARKGKVINEWAEETGKKVSRPREQPCKWCERFKDAGCYTCINCGKPLNKSIML